MLEALDHDPDRQNGIQYPSCFEAIDVEKLTYGPSYCVRGSIDMFSLLRSFLPCMSEFLGKRLLQSTNSQQIVSMVFFVSFYDNFVLADIRTFYWASEKQTLNLWDFQLIVEELTIYWAEVKVH